MKWSDLWNPKTNQIDEPKLKHIKIIRESPGNYQYEITDSLPTTPDLFPQIDFKTKWIMFTPPQLKGKIKFKQWSTIIDLKELPKITWWTRLKFRIYSLFHK